jgi:hypothetical protein
MSNSFQEANEAGSLLRIGRMTHDALLAVWIRASLCAGAMFEDDCGSSSAKFGSVAARADHRAEGTRRRGRAAGAADAGAARATNNCRSCFRQEQA